MTTIAVAGAQQRLVDVVMKDVPEPSSIFATEVARQSLGQSVTDRVRMTETLALDHLDDIVALLELG